jgi:hypothetical protein
MNTPQESFQASFSGDSALAVHHEFKPQIPPEGLKNAECEKGPPPIRPPIPYVPPTDLHEKWETKQIKVELLDRTKFQMPTYGSGNNKEYLVHVIAILRLIEQKRTPADVKEAFTALVKVRKEMSPFFNFPEDKSAAKKIARKKKLSKLNRPSRSRNPLRSNRLSKFCQHCKAKGGPHLTHNTKKCRRYDGNGNPISLFQDKPADARKPTMKGGDKQMAYLTATVESLVKKGHKKAMKGKKRKRSCAYNFSSSDSNSE